MPARCDSTSISNHLATRAFAECCRSTCRRISSWRFRLRGDLPPNNLEFKLVDESGENVWWVNRRRVRVSARVDAIGVAAAALPVCLGAVERAAAKGQGDRDCRVVGGRRPRHDVARRSDVPAAAGDEAVCGYADRHCDFDSCGIPSAAIRRRWQAATPCGDRSRRSTGLK